MSLQQTWIGNLRVNHDYPQHVWVAALRQALAGVRGKELIIWDNGWEIKKQALIREVKKLSVNYGMIGGQRELYKYLKSPSKGKLNICKIWIAGSAQSSLPAYHYHFSVLGLCIHRTTYFVCTLIPYLENLSCFSLQKPTSRQTFDISDTVGYW